MALALLLAAGPFTAPAAMAAPPTFVSFTFDNGVASAYTLGVQQALDPHGVDGTFYVNSGTIGGSPNFLSWAQLSTLQAGGHEIGGKTTHFVDLTTATPQVARDEVCGDHAALVAHGLQATTFAYPYGAFNDAAKDLVRECGYGNARTAGGIGVAGPNFIQPVPPSDFFSLATYAPSGSITLADLQAVVTGAAGQGGGWVPIAIQSVCSQALEPSAYAGCKASGGNIELDVLNSFLDWLAAAGQPAGAPEDTVVRTMGQVATQFDSTAPSTAISCEGSPCTTTPYEGFALVTLTGTDAGSGAAATRYTTDGTDPTTSSSVYTQPLRLTESTNLRFRSWDHAGNAGAVGAQQLNVNSGSPDSTPPTTTISCNGAPCSTAAYTGSVSVSMSADDGRGSGVAAIRYTSNGSVPTSTSPTYSAPFNVIETTTLTVSAIDAIGNSETPVVRQITITPSPVRVALTWDDGKFSNWYLGWLRALQPHGVESTFYINSDDVGTGSSGDGLPGFMRWSDLSTLAAAGNQIGGHTLNHINLLTASPAERTRQACEDRQRLLLHDLKPTTFAYPEGAFDQSVKTLIAGCGYSNARSAGGLTANGPTFAESPTPPDLFGLRAYSLPANGQSLELTDLQGIVRAAASHGGGWVPIVGHTVCSQQFMPADYAECKTYAGNMELSTLNAFLDWMQQAGQPGGAPAGASFATVRDVIGPALPSDTTDPVSTITCNGTACGSVLYPRNTSVALSATDAGSGIDRIVYTTDGSDPTASPTARVYTAPFTITAATTVRYLALDRAMNAETPRSRLISVDGTAPTTAIACGGTTCSTGWYRANVSVTLTATDNAGGSGVNVIRYTTNGSAPTGTSPVYNGPLTLTQTTTVRYFATDVAGNAEASRSQLVRIDAASPNVSITSPGSGATIRRVANQVMRATATDVGTGSGAGSGIARVQFYLDGVTLLATDTSNPYQFTWQPRTVALGAHTLTAIATDTAGNTRTSTPVLITIVP